MINLSAGELQKYIEVGLHYIASQKRDWLERQSLQSILLDVNPYLISIKQPMTGREFVSRQLQARLNELEEKLFSTFLKKLAIFIAVKTNRGYPSPFKSIDLELIKNDTHYLIAIKPTQKWESRSRRRKLEKAFSRAVSAILFANGIHYRVEPVLGICVGNAPTQYRSIALEIVGQNFWHFISGNRNLHTEIIDPLLIEAQNYRQEFERESQETLEQLQNEFYRKYCTPDEQIKWPTLIEDTCYNFDPHQPYP